MSHVTTEQTTTEYDKLFIGGKWTEPSTSEVIEVHCPATGEYVGKVPLAAAADVDAAVAAALDTAEGAGGGHRRRAQTDGGAQRPLRQAARRRNRPAPDVHRDHAVDEWDWVPELLRRPCRRSGQMAGSPQRRLRANHRAP